MGDEYWNQTLTKFVNKRFYILNAAENCSYANNST